ncbi:hypothetical protein ASG38_15100 [Flavobacterium sp. Leaf359]|uniref:HNH endonuclease signature motif containing protein n=1 Tax=Flavobacterium sp. Leaf359 TaxID=1736351 RepID=UPI0006FFF480|nr:HNH endonuclease signature motif containing protein [Flavobacterium sp. Leaf359]KQS45934.1 hypothetical protein ASG38_15100 [Flavobacterium sp. Leaf359]
MGKRNWTDQELELLRKEYPKTETSKIAKKLGRPVGSVKSKATALALRKETGFHGKVPWSEWDDSIIRLLYPDQEIEHIMFVLERSSSAVYGRALVLGVSRSAEYMEKLQEKTNMALAKAGEKSRFRTGDGKTGWNRGRKQSEYMSPESMEKTKRTRFAKGNVPKNYKPIGYERISKDGYIEVKVRDADDSTDNFEFKHRIVYESHHGPIPEGMIVEFVDGNFMNLDIGNLRLVTRRENLLNNSLKDSCIAKRLLATKEPEIIEKALREIPEVIELKRKSLILKRQLNDK